MRYIAFFVDKAEEDDEEDNILRELNPKTNVDIKQQLISIERDNFEHFLESKPIALIVYWLN
uniref:Uncharacterized protein n=1 Tax=Romanomermis culicivorax TaxID=13658 RepID=A0A915J9S3_ROMCU